MKKILTKVFFNDFNDLIYSKITCIILILLLTLLTLLTR